MSQATSKIPLGPAKASEGQMTAREQALWIKKVQEEALKSLPQHKLYIGLWIRNDPPLPNDFHWGLYYHQDINGGMKYHIKGLGGGWIADHGRTGGVFKSQFLCVLIQIGSIPAEKEARFDQLARSYDGSINTTPGITCRTSSATAVIVPTTPPLTVSFSQLAADVRAFQQQLAELGIGHGDAVSIALPNNYEFVVAFLAAAAQRAIAAPLNPAYKQSEFEFYIDDLSSAVALVPRGAVARNEASVKAAGTFSAAVAEVYLDAASRTVVLDVKTKGKLATRSQPQQQQPLLTATPSDVALVLHTSGTTGRPKAVPLTHRNLTRTMANIQATYELSPSDRTYLVMPLFHVHGLLAGFLAPLAAGGSVIIPAKFSATTFWPDFVTHGANWYTAVPTIHQILLKNPAPPPQSLPAIRFIRSCSSALSPKTLADLEATYHAPVLEAYAMTEAAHQMCSNPLPSRGPHKPGTVGVGQGVEVRILGAYPDHSEQPDGSEGEISIRGDNVTSGYINNPKANAESFTPDGFFRTGDQGKKDPDGYVVITGRIKELINRGGEKISPIELDNTLTAIPGVAEAVSFGIPDELMGQIVGAAVVAKPGADITDAAVTAFVAQRLAKHKVPSRVWLLKEIPKTATGKVQRRKVAETLLARDSKAKL
ncbi:hypothetical protein DV735_g4052, partial [Chaetothyriales sp. CBS 134920]